MKGNIYLLPTYMHLCEYIYLLIDNRYLYKCHVSAPDKNVDICFLTVGFKRCLSEMSSSAMAESLKIKNPRFSRWPAPAHWAQGGQLGCQ